MNPELASSILLHRTRGELESKLLMIMPILTCSYRNLVVIVQGLGRAATEATFARVTSALGDNCTSLGHNHGDQPKCVQSTQQSPRLAPCGSLVTGGTRRSGGERRWSPLRAGRVVVPPLTQGTVAVHCLLSVLVKLIGTPNGTGPPLQPPPPENRPADVSTRNRRSHPVHIHAPLATAQFFRNPRRLAPCSDERITNATIKLISGITSRAGASSRWVLSSACSRSRRLSASSARRAVAVREE
jgi:hypothetical protein